MKIKLLSTLFIILLSVNPFSVMADEVVDTSSCKMVVLSKEVQPNFGELQALSCPHLSTEYIVQFFTNRTRCVLWSDNTSYKVTGTCTSYVLYRIQ